MTLSSGWKSGGGKREGGERESSDRWWKHGPLTLDLAGMMRSWWQGRPTDGIPALVSKSAPELGYETPWQSVLSDQLDFAAGSMWLKADSCELTTYENVKIKLYFTQQQ